VYTKLHVEEAKLTRSRTNAEHLAAVAVHYLTWA
jgi:hypothetical protein